MALNVNILTLLVLSFVLVVLVVTAETQKCTQVINDLCTMPYIRTVDAVDSENNQEICTALAVYLRCVEDVKDSEKLQIRPSFSYNIDFDTNEDESPKLWKYFCRYK